MNPQPACKHGRTLPANTGATAQFLLTHPQFRRTDYHFSLDRAQMHHETEYYLPRITRLLEAQRGRVMLDTTRPCVCL
jgi:hypothetical protein